MMLRRLSIILCAALTLLCAKASQTETLHYKVVYKWGLIHKQGGRATFTLTDNGRTAHAIMAARTEPWADHFFSVRDTLTTEFDSATRLPRVYNRIAHEDGAYAHDVVTFTSNGQKSSAKCSRSRRGKKEKTNTRTDISLEAEGPAVDLLSSFYYIRHLDFNKMKPGHAVRLNIFSGKRKELLTISYKGIEKIKTDQGEREAYKVTFMFTSEGRKRTSEPIEAWLATDARRTPLKLVGDIKVGKIQCIYVP